MLWLIEQILRNDYAESTKSALPMFIIFSPIFVVTGHELRRDNELS